MDTVELPNYQYLKWLENRYFCLYTRKLQVLSNSTLVWRISTVKSRLRHQMSRHVVISHLPAPRDAPPKAPAPTIQVYRPHCSTTYEAAGVLSQTEWRVGRSVCFFKESGIWLGCLSFFPLVSYLSRWLVELSWIVYFGNMSNTKVRAASGCLTWKWIFFIDDAGRASTMKTITSCRCNPDAAACLKTTFRKTQLRAIEPDMRPSNIGPSFAWKTASSWEK